jgi:hypothetical protein
VNQDCANKTKKSEMRAFRMSANAPNNKLLWRLPFGPSPYAMAIVKQRARDVQGTIDPDLFPSSTG